MKVQMHQNSDLKSGSVYLYARITISHKEKFLKINLFFVIISLLWIGGFLNIYHLFSIIYNTSHYKHEK